MDNKADKYYDDSDVMTQTRTSRNSRLYREVSDKYSDLDNLPLEDNTDEIDMDKLKKMIADMNKKDDSFSRPIDKDLNILEKKKRNIDENKIYDINKLLDKAKYENDKLKEPDNKLLQTSRNILSKLSGDTDYDIRNDYHKYDRSSRLKDLEEDSKNDNLELTREMKYHTKKIYNDPLIEQVMPDNDLAMDLFFDLKPTGDTIVTKPIREQDINEYTENKNKDIKNTDTKITKSVDLKNFEDTSDIDIIKKDSTSDDFFTNSYKFSSKDFTDGEGKAGNIFKILLLILVIIIFIGVIVYFVLNFGLGVK